ncbi:MAG: IS30 family transposase [Alphaproteobacteria bacterium]|nr:IS30 family transposase [Alphaproteobacteria bacterium]
MYHHITREQRAVIAALRRHGERNAEIARVLGVHRASIGRELRRNGENEYTVFLAQRRIRARRRAAKREMRIIESDPGVAAFVEKLLRRTLSPEQVAYVSREASHTTIYAWIRRSRPDLRACLRRRGKRRRRYGTRGILSRYQAAKRPLAERPAVVANRSRIGDWEGDTARGREKPALLVYAERKSRYVVARALPRATADTVQQETRRLLAPYPRHTITDDNGSEFALHRLIEHDTQALVYFARPGHPEERGTCENTIGLIREFFPKKTDFATLTRRQVSDALWLINHRPRKCLSWQTPCRVFGYCCT